jgi:hypothetical protein
MNERDPRFFDVYQYDATSYARTLVYRNDSGYFPAGVSPDDKWVSLVKTNTSTDSDIYLWNTGRPRNSSNGSKSRSRCNNEWPSRRQNVAIQQSIVLRTVCPRVRRVRGQRRVRVGCARGRARACAAEPVSQRERCARRAG